MFHSTSAVSHLPDFHQSSHIYRAPSRSNFDRYYAHPADTTRSASNSPTTPLTNVGCRARGGDGRFVARAEIVTSDIPDGKVCGWCRTTVTSQWRVGPTTGSIGMPLVFHYLFFSFLFPLLVVSPLNSSLTSSALCRLFFFFFSIKRFLLYPNDVGNLTEMGTLCNACGINYRRALSKMPAGKLNLDTLAQCAGHPTARPSIQKALKRVRKQSASRRARTAAMTVSNGRVAVAALVDQVSSHPHCISSRHNYQRSHSSTSRSGNSLTTNSIASSPTSLSFPSQPSPPQSSTRSPLTPPAAPPPEPLHSSHPPPAPGARQCARLPPFQSFIGQLQARAFM